MDEAVACFAIPGNVFHQAGRFRLFQGIEHIVLIKLVVDKEQQVEAEVAADHGCRGQYGPAAVADPCQPLTDDDRLQETLNELIDDLF